MNGENVWKLTRVHVLCGVGILEALLLKFPHFKAKRDVPQYFPVISVADRFRFLLIRFILIRCWLPSQRARSINIPVTRPGNMAARPWFDNYLSTIITSEIKRKKEKTSGINYTLERPLSALKRGCILFLLMEIKLKEHDKESPISSSAAVVLTQYLIQFQSTWIIKCFLWLLLTSSIVVLRSGAQERQEVKGALGEASKCILVSIQIRCTSRNKIVPNLLLLYLILSSQMEPERPVPRV